MLTEDLLHMSYENSRKALSRQSNGTVDAITRVKPSSDTTSQEVNDDGEQSIQDNAQKTARKARHDDSGMRCMADKVQSQFNYFPPITKNNHL